MNADIIDILDNANYILEDTKNQTEVLKNYCNANPEQKIEKIQSSINSIFEKQNETYKKLNQFSKELFREIFVKNQ